MSAANSRPRAPPKSPVARQLRKLGVDPFEQLVEAARDPDAPMALRVKVWLELATYCAPRLRSIEVEGRTTMAMPSTEAIRKARQEVFGFE
jgi:hypothetical protein